MSRSSVCVVMPAFNESAGIAGFLDEIEKEMSGYELSFVVVDDMSRDDTSTVVETWAGSRRDLRLVRNSQNLGHGMSTVTALHGGLRSRADVVVAVDGDGQFLGRDMACVVATLIAQGADVAEGARLQRDDPLFRRATSRATRVLVRARCGVAPRDANTPLRAYRPEILRQLLDTLPANPMTPNLMMSAAARKARLEVVEVEVESRPRRGPDVLGSTWNARRGWLPSRRFIGFCRDATAQWFDVNAVENASYLPAPFADAESAVPSKGGRQTTAALDL